jgi:hypothetical protein
MNQAEFAFWREAVLAALHVESAKSAVARADEALTAYRTNAAERDAHHASLKTTATPTGPTGD